MRFLRAIAREPLVHFFLVGALLMAADRWRRADPPEEERRSGAGSPPAPSGSSRQIVVDQEVRAWLKDGLTRAGGQPPSAAELDAAVDRWIDDEVLYREGLLRGLDRDDPAVRRRIADKMSFVLGQEVVIPAPGEEELRAWFDGRRDSWARPDRIDFTHVFVVGEGAAAEARAGDLLRQLSDGAPPEQLGDRFSGGQRYRGRKLADLTASFGAEFAGGLERQPLGAWHLRRSRHGLHLVRVDAVEAGRAADFASARLDVEKEWRDSKRAEALSARVRALRERWRVVER